MKRYFTIIAAAMAALVVVSCKSKEEEQVIVRGITVTPSTLTLDAGETEVLTAEITPSNATDKTVNWSSSAEAVATVSKDGVVTAVGSGKAVITAKSGTKSGTCEVTVMGAATGVKISPASIELSYNESSTLVATVEPEGFVKNTAVTWVSSNPEAVAVAVDESNPLSAKLTAGSTKGDFTVTVTTVDGGFSKECKVSVVGLSANGLKTGPELVAFLQQASEMEATDDVKLAADIDMEGATLPQAVSFKGTFNGQNYSIKNAVITQPLFAINDGTVKNLVIASNCKLQPATLEFAPVVGVNNGTVSGCINNALISYTQSVASEDYQYHLIAGIAEVNNRDGVIDNCTNNGEINIQANDRSDAPTVAGIVGVSAGYVRNSKNTAPITHNPGYAALKKGGVIGEVVGGAINIPHQVGGIVGLFYNRDVENKAGLTDRGIEDCTNTGNITVTALGGQATATCRAYVSGIVGEISGGYIKKCTNEGNVVLNHSSGKNTNVTTDKQMFVGGIYCINLNDFTVAAGCTYPACSDCVNKGDITMDTDHTGAYMYIGGISANTDLENDATKCINPLISGCVNYGKVTGKGYGKIRAAGITAQTGNIHKCINYGTIELGENVLANANTGSFAGNISCYHAGPGHELVDNEAYGNIKLNNAAMAGGLVGILGGRLGEVAITGNKVNCTIEGPAGSYLGMLTGYCNATDEWTVGTSESPCYVAGTIKLGETTTTLTEDNYLSNWGATNSYLIGWDKKGDHDSANIKFLK